MKTTVENSSRCFWLIFPFILATLFLATGCATQKPDPLKGWKEIYTSNPDKAITDDYHAYIDKLQPKEREGVSIIGYFKDATGQHAVEIEVSIDGIFEGKRWRHVLFFDSENKRTKVIKYAAGHYSLW